jgi:hypothetical protein
MTPLESGMLADAAYAAPPPAARTSAVAPAMMTMRFLNMFPPDDEGRDKRHASEKTTRPKVLSRSLPFLRGRDQDGSGWPACCNRDPFVPHATPEITTPILKADLP